MESFSLLVFHSIPLLVACFLVAATSFWLGYRLRLHKHQQQANLLLAEASRSADLLYREKELAIARSSLDQQSHLEEERSRDRQKLQRQEAQLDQREQQLQKRCEQLEKKQALVDKQRSLLATEEKKLLVLQTEAIEERQQLRTLLASAAGWTLAEAKERLKEELIETARSEAAAAMRRLFQEAEEEAQHRAKKILTTAINRMAVDVVAQDTVASVSLPNEEMKGRIIGKEGRNIRTLERLTGVNFLVDDTPGAIILSGFDPLRLHVAQLALSDLVSDGRVYPSRIEEAVAKAQEESQSAIFHWGQEAAISAGALDLHPELLRLLGSLKLRHSVGQNVLDHSIEVSAIMGLLSGELGLNGKLARRIGLLHDVGKALSHPFDKPHALVGHDVALRYGEEPLVAVGIGCHHGEMEPTSFEARLCAAADALSASRLGARSQQRGGYFERRKELEKVALDCPGVERAYAMQAGRELLVMVQPDQIDDAGLSMLLHELSCKIEKMASCRGKIKVTAIRERAVTKMLNKSWCDEG